MNEVIFLGGVSGVNLVLSVLLLIEVTGLKLVVFLLFQISFFLSCV